MRISLVVIDMQREFLDGATTEPSLSDAVEIINHVADLCRAADRPVLWIYDLESCGPGEPGFELIDGLRTEPKDAHIHKLHGNAFRDTTLADELGRYGTDFVLVAGFKAEACVLSTLKGFEDRDIPHAVIRQSIVSTSADGAGFVERISPIISYEVVESLLRSNSATS